MHEDGTLAVQGPLGLALRDPSGVWTVADCPGIDWGMPVATSTTYYLKIDHLPFVGLRWMEDRLLAGADRTVVAFDKNSGTCETICTTEEGQLAVAPGRTDRVVVGRSVQGGSEYTGQWANIYDYSRRIGECTNGIWTDSVFPDTQAFTFIDLSSGLFATDGSAQGYNSISMPERFVCDININLHYVQTNASYFFRHRDERFTFYCLPFVHYDIRIIKNYSFGLRQNLWFDEEEKYGWYSFGPSRIKLNR